MNIQLDFVRHYSLTLPRMMDEVVDSLLPLDSMKSVQRNGKIFHFFRQKITLFIFLASIKINQRRLEKFVRNYDMNVDTLSYGKHYAMYTVLVVTLPKLTQKISIIKSYDNYASLNTRLDLFINTLSKFQSSLYSTLEAFEPKSINTPLSGFSQKTMWDNRCKAYSYSL